MLDGVVPYATVTGNHDYATLCDRNSSAPSTGSLRPVTVRGTGLVRRSGPGNGTKVEINSTPSSSFRPRHGLPASRLWDLRETRRPIDPTWMGTERVDQYPDRASILTTQS